MYLAPADTFTNNPQYRIEVPESDDWMHGEKNIFISLMQKPKSANRKMNRPYPIGLTLFKVCSPYFSWQRNDMCKSVANLLGRTSIQFEN